MKKNNRVLGVIGIGAYNANWNADMEGNPRSNNGRFEGSSHALRYSLRNYWREKGQNVFYTKTMSKEKKNIPFNTLKLRYESLFDTKLAENQSSVVAENLFKCVDVMNFGATFAEKKNNLSINGVVQFTDGFNAYDNANLVRVGLLSPFTNSNSSDANQTTMGSRAFLDEAHFLYSFTVNPFNCDKFAEVVDGFEGYTEEAYKEFKDAALISANLYNSVAKAGCENEFALFVELKEGSLKLIPNLHQYIKFNKGEKNEFDLTILFEALEEIKDEIDQVDIFINKVKCSVVVPEDTNIQYKTFHLLNKREI